MSSAIANALMVGTGGFLGAMLRYGLTGLVHRQAPQSTFPYGTLMVNLIGCLMIGAVSGLIESKQLMGPTLRLFVMTGLLGGFTTYSAFGYETFTMIRSESYLHVAANVGVHVVLGLALVYVGYTLATSK